MMESNSLFSLPEGKLRLEPLADGIRLTLSGHQTVLASDEARALASQLIETSADIDRLNSVQQNRIHVQFILFDAEQPPTGDLSGSPKTASVRCWIKDQTQTNATYVAIGWVEQDGWVITNLVEHRVVTRKDYADSADIVYYDQVLIDEEVFLFVIEDGF